MSDSIPKPVVAAPSAYASVGARVLAALIDGLILSIPTGMANQASPVLGGIVIWFIYAPILESSAAQATLGKYLMGIQVAGEDGSRLTLKTATLRSLMKIVSACILFIGFLMALFTERRQTLHDIVMNTVVVPGKYTGSVFDAWVDQLRSIFNSDRSAR